MVYSTVEDDFDLTMVIENTRNHVEVAQHTIQEDVPKVWRHVSEHGQKTIRMNQKF